MASAQDVADSQSDDPSVRARSPREASGVTKCPRSCSAHPRPTTLGTCTDGAAYDHPDRNAHAGGNAANGPKIAGDGSIRTPGAQHPTRHVAAPWGPADPPVGSRA
jgi:hypothetical protein